MEGYKQVGDNTTTPLRKVRVKNAEVAATMTVGQIVVVNTADPTGRSVVLLATANSKLRKGVVIEETIAAGKWGWIAIDGSVEPIKCITGATAIVVGDTISTSATAGAGTLGTSNGIGIALSALAANTATPTDVVVMIDKSIS